MDCLFERPKWKIQQDSGLISRDQFQLAYVTNDLGKACDIFSKRYGIKEYKHFDAPLPSGGHLKLALAWAGGAMYEIIEGGGPGTDFYFRDLPKNEFAIRQHHLGFFLSSQSEWDALISKVEQEGWRVTQKNTTPGFLSAIFIEAPELGHYLEYIYPEAEGIAFFQGVPVS